MSLLLRNSGGIWKSMPSRFLLAVGFVALDSRGAKPLGSFGNLFRFPSVFDLGKSLGSQENRCRGWISQYLPRLGGARIQSAFSNFHWANQTLLNSWAKTSGTSCLDSKPDLEHFCLCIRENPEMWENFVKLNRGYNHLADFLFDTTINQSQSEFVLVWRVVVDQAEIELAKSHLWCTWPEMKMMKMNTFC